MIGAFLARIFGGGLLQSVIGLAEKHIAAETDREALKADIIREHMRTRADYMRAGGLWLMLLFAVPLAFWWGAVLVYSVLWCRACAFPQTWSIAALPAPLDQWAGLIVLSIFGVLGIDRLKR